MRRVLHIVFCIGLLCQALPAQHRITVEPWRRLVPSDNLPAQVQPMKGNNNIDAVQFRGRYYVAFRTAPSHFASRKTRLYLISSADLQSWRYETEFHLGADLREPRFLAFGDSLYFYFFEGGTKLWKFEPRHIYMSVSAGGGAWSPAADLHLDGYVPWRLREREGTVYLSAYYGVDLYNSRHTGALRLFRSQDARHFESLTGGSQIPTQGGEEGEFIFDEAGNLWATVRLEGSGAYVARAHRDSLSQWHTRFTKRKYDSALMFRHEGSIYVVARRHLKGDATKVEHPNRRQRRRNLIRYSLSRKRTALYRLDQAQMRLQHVMDFPGCGDTAFPAIARISDHRYLLLNYSNDITGKDRTWISGQLKPTYVYWTVLEIR